MVREVTQLTLGFLHSICITVLTNLINLHHDITAQQSPTRRTSSMMKTSIFKLWSFVEARQLCQLTSDLFKPVHILSMSNHIKFHHNCHTHQTLCNILRSFASLHSNCFPSDFVGSFSVCSATLWLILTICFEVFVVQFLISSNFFLLHLYSWILCSSRLCSFGLLS